MAYSREKIYELCEKWLVAKKAKGFYDANYKRWAGKTTEGNEYESDVVAEFVLKNIKSFQDIEPLERLKSYDANHDGSTENDKSNRTEERIALAMFNHCKEGEYFDCIGKVIDYQTPLTYGHVPALDLLSINEGTLYLLELKQMNNKENLLRCVLEIYTYMKQLDIEKLINDFDKKISGSINNIVAAPLVYRDKRQIEEFHEMLDEDTRPNLKRLMKELNITEVFVYYEEDGKYYFEREKLV